MLHDNKRSDGDGHERFKELSALANSGVLSASEWSDLDLHLRVCEGCREIHDQYQLLSTVGMPFLAAVYSHPQEQQQWDDSEVREKVLARVREAERSPEDRSEDPFLPTAPAPLLLGFAVNRWVTGGLAACLGIAVAFGAYQLGSSRHTARKQISLQSSLQEQAQKFVAEKESSEELVKSQSARISEMQVQNVKQDEEVTTLRTELRALEDHSRVLAAAEGKTEAQLRAVSEQRDNLTAQLQQAEQLFQNEKSELVRLQAEHDRELLHTASQESKIGELTAANRDQERRLGDDEQFLSSDRDIRELMGARKLYIADVFDVDSGSRTRKPFGRVFYTQNKSLIFYAFDLDHQAGVKNASIFQVWGQKDAELTEKAHPLNLGVLYMDSESNRRWVLRLDDPKHLAEIDAVFVTVEPHGGSPKPTGKPFLYALLRKEPNHP
jgi:hypothetical protein